MKTNIMVSQVEGGIRSTHVCGLLLKVSRELKTKKCQDMTNWQSTRSDAADDGGRIMKVNYTSLSSCMIEYL